MICGCRKPYSVYRGAEFVEFAEFAEPLQSGPKICSGWGGRMSCRSSCFVSLVVGTRPLKHSGQSPCVSLGMFQYPTTISSYLPVTGAEPAPSPVWNPLDLLLVSPQPSPFACSSRPPPFSNVSMASRMPSTTRCMCESEHMPFIVDAQCKANVTMSSALLYTITRDLLDGTTPSLPNIL